MAVMNGGHLGRGYLLCHKAIRDTQRQNALDDRPADRREFLAVFGVHMNRMRVVRTADEQADICFRHRAAGRDLDLADLVILKIFDFWHFFSPFLTL